MKAVGLLVCLLLAPGVRAGDQNVRDGALPPSPSSVAVTRTSAVTGVVMSDEPDSRPVRRAIVSLKHSESGTTRAAVTDDAGRFVVDGLRAGRYTLTVTKDGWVTTLYGAKSPWRPPGVSIAVAAGQSTPPIQLRMMRGGVLAGRILDERGNPIVNVEPRVLEIRSVAGRPELKDASRQDRQTLTDDRGEFRFYGLPPGRYVIQAAVTGATSSVSWGTPGSLNLLSSPSANATAPPVSAEIRRFVPTFYPGTTDAIDALPIVLGPGQERAGLDFVVRAERASAIRGRIIGPDGAPMAGATIGAESAAANGLKGPLDWSRRVYSTSDARGEFTLPQLAPGRYTVTAEATSRAIAAAFTNARPGSAIPRDLYAQVDVMVATADLSGMTLALRLGQTISGRVSYDTDGAAPANQVLVRLYAWGDDPDATTTPIAGVLRPDEKGAFSFPGVKPGHYALAIAASPNAPSRWSFRTATAGGRDVLAAGLEIAADHDVPDLAIALTDRGGELSGRLLDQLGRPAPEYYVFAFPVDRALWHRYTPMLKPPTRPGTDGRYRIAPLPVGDYYVVALTGFDEFDYLDTAFLEQLLPGAIRVTLGDKEQREQDIQMR